MLGDLSKLYLEATRYRVVRRNRDTGYVSSLSGALPYEAISEFNRAVAVIMSAENSAYREVTMYRECGHDGYEIIAHCSARAFVVEGEG